ncbi:hypothetical protein MPRG_55900 [Mycobacterium paragordonae]|uniref:Uncharacterized protein n=1 Tax=Mycobacterium paragordonae TaxID=1389713 RepID=A0ABQ1CDJ7_9MYCO|nr:hypothetical protein MPRG_55900 [Mycobacterium paragordonae]
MIIETGQGFGAGAIDQRETTHHVHLPQLHRRPRSHRFHFRERRSRNAGSIIPARTNARYAADSEGTGRTPRLSSSKTNRRGPQYGRDRRNSNNAASTAADI